MAPRASSPKGLTVAITGPTGEMGRAVVAALERSSAATTARPIPPVGPVMAAVRSLGELARGAMHSYYRIVAAPVASARFWGVSGAEIGLSISVFLASAVEAVEALTIVMAVGQARSWRSALARRR